MYVIRRLREDLRFSAGGEKFEFKYLRQCLTDWKTYIASEYYYDADSGTLMHLPSSGDLHGIVGISHVLLGLC